MHNCPPPLQPGFGDAETAFTYHRPSIPPLTVLVPDASIQQLFAHRQWRAGLRLANYIADGSINLSGETVLEVSHGARIP
jgi:predicted nicotinamide N-methyase